VLENGVLEMIAVEVERARDAIAPRRNLATRVGQFDGVAASDS
jgi:hypothetical protein